MAIIFGVMMVPTMVLMGGLVDYGMAIKTKSQLTATLDAAMLAAMLQYADDEDVDYQKIIEDYIDQNFTSSKKKLHGTVTELIAAEISEEGEMRSSVKAVVPTNFLKFVHQNEFEFTISAAVMVGGSSIEVALVLDNTGSMNGSKITSLIASAKNLVNTIMDDDDDSDLVKMAVIPFADYVNIGMVNRSEPGLDIPEDYSYSWIEKKKGKCKGKGKGWGKGWGNSKKCDEDVEKHEDYKWYGCMGSRLHDNPDVASEDYDELGVPGLMTTSNTCGYVKTVTRLTNSKTDILTALTNMNSSGSTYIPSGLAWGWRSVTDHAPFADGVPYSDKSVKKVIVLMTDGENTSEMKKVEGNGVLHHTGDVYEHDWGSTNDANTITAELCDAIKANEIIIYSIAFDVVEGSTVQTLMKNCAGNGGQYFDADNNTELADAFRQIGLSLLNLRLSK
ncbi:MAG: VWA domain-containing protein [bacterium]|nr:VWA domain-containing protein [bacterium]